MGLIYVITNGQSGQFIAEEPSYAAALAWQLCSSFPGQYKVTQKPIPG